jgi:tRNA(adenine34) deaminase
MKTTIDEDLWMMALALEEADNAYKEDEVPIGAVLVDGQNKILSKAYNLKEKTHNPLGHAELFAIGLAAKEISNWRLIDCTLYVTCEPCPMCLAAMVQSRIKRLVFGAYDLKGGALSLGYRFHQDSRLNHSFSLMGGLRHFECSKILSKFFREKRDIYNRNKAFDS